MFMVLKCLMMPGFSWLITLTGPNNNQSQRGRGGYSSRFGTRGRGGGYSTRGRGFSQQVNSTGWNQSQSNADNRPVCKTCGRFGHSALKCYNRFDVAYQSDDIPKACSTSLR